MTKAMTTPTFVPNPLGLHHKQRHQRRQDLPLYAPARPARHVHLEILIRKVRKDCKLLFSAVTDKFEISVNYANVQGRRESIASHTRTTYKRSTHFPLLLMPAPTSTATSLSGARVHRPKLQTFKLIRLW